MIRARVYGSVLLSVAAVGTAACIEVEEPSRRRSSAGETRDEDQGQTESSEDAERLLNAALADLFPDGEAAPAASARSIDDDVSYSSFGEYSGEPLVVSAGDYVSVGGSFESLSDPVDALCVAFGSPDAAWCIPLTSDSLYTSGEGEYGDVEGEVEVPADLCRMLSSCHEIEFYEFLRTSAGNFTDYSTRPLVLACGGCEDASCAALLGDSLECGDEVDECSDDSDCGSGQLCVSGECLYPDVGTDCDTDDDCYSDEQCMQGACVPSFDPGSCSPGCASDEVCFQGTCITATPDETCGSGCGEGAVCFQSQCVDCELLGALGTSLPGCEGEPATCDCNSTQVCVEGSCVNAEDLVFTLHWESYTDFDFSVTGPFEDYYSAEDDNTSGGPGASETVIIDFVQDGTYVYEVRHYNGDGGNFEVTVTYGGEVVHSDGDYLAEGGIWTGSFNWLP